MSLRYLLDGYNIVHQIQGLYLKELEEQRKGLVRFVETKRPHGSMNNSVTIVFDGRTGYGDCSYSSQFKVVFSKGETADAVIKRTVEKAKNKKRIVVVSNDKGIRSVVSALGARVMHVKDFLNAKASDHRQAPRKAGTPEKSDPKKISKTLEYQINREFEEIWIKRKGKR